MSEMTPFESASRAVTAGAGQATMVEQSRAVAEVQAAVVVAHRNPRSKAAAMTEMREVCAIPQMAERAFFRFNRGGGPVSGETVHLARELARIWGNVTYGLQELSRNDAKGESEMLAFAWDLQTNARAQTAFIVPHVRDTRQGAKKITETRDVYENNANMGARRLREMIFAVLPVWFREEAAAICRDTLEHGGGEPLVKRIADAVEAYAKIGITPAQIAKRVGRPVDDMTAEDVASLRVTYTSIKRGEITKEEEFPKEEAAPPPNADGFEAAAAGQAPKAPEAAKPKAGRSAKPSPPTAFYAIRPDGTRDVLPSIEEWEAWWMADDGPVEEAPLDTLRALREANGALMGEYAGAHPEAVQRVQTAITDALSDEAAS